MITIDDIGSKISITNFVRTNEYIDKFFPEIVSETDFDKDFCFHLEMEWDNPEVFKEIKNQAKEIYENSYTKIYEFYLGEHLNLTPLKIEIPDFKKKLILQNGVLTGRTYAFCRRNYMSEKTYTTQQKAVVEVNYNGELYGVLDKNTIFSVKPIKWILIVPKRNNFWIKIFSSKVISYAYDIQKLINSITQKPYTKGKPFNLNNDAFEIENGVLKQMFINNIDIIRLPEGITEITLFHHNLPYEKEEAKSIYLPRSVKKINETNHNIPVKDLELHANIILNNEINIYGNLHIHYQNYNELLLFFINNIENKNITDKSNKKYIYGPKLTKEQTLKLKKCLINFKWKKENNNSEEEINENEDNIASVIEKLNIYYNCYSNREERINKLNKKISNYNKKIDEFEKEYNEGSIISKTPEQLYDEFLHELTDDLETIKKDTEENAEYFILLYLINKCIDSIEFNREESDYSIDNDICKLRKRILSPYNYWKYCGKLKGIFITEKNKIINYLNNSQDKELEYSSVAEFEIYFRTIFHQILIDIKEEIKDNLAKDNKRQMDTILKHMSEPFYEAENQRINNWKKYIAELSKTIDEKIKQNNLSDDYLKDKEILLSYVNKTKSLYNNPDIRAKLLSSCNTLKTQRKPEEFEKMDRLMKEMKSSSGVELARKQILLYRLIIGSYSSINGNNSKDNISIDKYNNEKEKEEKVLYAIAFSLLKLEAEIDERIRMQQTLKRCRVKL